MSTVDDIKTFTEKLNVKFALAHNIKLYLLVRNIQRYVKEELNEGGVVKFTSQDLRSLIMSIEKVHKAINKKISFFEFEKQFFKYKEVGNKEVWDETKKLAEYCKCAKVLQSCYSMLNHFATLLYLIEVEDEQEKVKSDKALTDSIISALTEYLEGND